MSRDNPLRTRGRLRHEVEQIVKLTDPFCAEYLDAEYGALIRRLIAKLPHKRPSPLERGDLRIWAAAAIYVVGSVNFLFDRSQRPNMTGDQLSYLTGVAKSTLAGKAKLIRDVLRIRQREPEFCRRALAESNPLASMISVNGLHRGCLHDATGNPGRSQATRLDPRPSRCQCRRWSERMIIIGGDEPVVRGNRYCERVGLASVPCVEVVLDQDVDKMTATSFAWWL